MNMKKNMYSQTDNTKTQKLKCYTNVVTVVANKI